MLKQRAVGWPCLVPLSHQLFLNWTWTNKAELRIEIPCKQTINTDTLRQELLYVVIVSEWKWPHYAHCQQSQFKTISIKRQITGNKTQDYTPTRLYATLHDMTECRHAKISGGTYESRGHTQPLSTVVCRVCPSNRSLVVISARLYTLLSFVFYVHVYGNPPSKSNCSPVGAILFHWKFSGAATNWYYNLAQSWLPLITWLAASITINETA